MKNNRLTVRNTFSGDKILRNDVPPLPQYHSCGEQLGIERYLIVAAPAIIQQ